LHTKG